MPTLGLKLRISSLTAKIAQVYTTGLQLWHKFTGQGLDVMGSGSALFNSSSDVIDIPISLDGQTAATICGWVKPSNAAEAVDNYIITFDEVFSTASNGFSIEIISNQYKGNVVTSAASDVLNGASSYAQNGKWTHVALTYDGTTAKFYEDGILRDSGAVAVGTGIENGEAAGKLGQDNASSDFPGNIAKVGVWTRALTEDEIKSIMAKTYSDLTTAEKVSLQGWYELESDSADSENANNGTDSNITYVNDTPAFRRLLDTSDQKNHVSLYTGRGMSFDGANDEISCGNVYNGIKSVVFLVNPDTTTEQFMQLQASGAVDVDVVSGTIGTTGWTSPTVYVNGKANSTLVAGQWQQVAVTSATGINANAVTFGKSNTAFGAFDMSNVKMFDIELTSAQVAELFANPEQVVPTGAAFSNIKGWWPLADGTITTIALDGSGNNNHGTITGPSNSLALPSPAPQFALTSNSAPMWFDGSNDYVSNATSLGALADSWSVSMWLLNETASTSQILVNRESASDMIVVGVIANGIRAVNYNGASVGISSTASTLEDGGLHHLVVTCSGATSGDMEIYVDGVAVSDGTSTLGTPTSSGWNIGRINGVSNPFKGIIYVATVWNTGLSAANVTTLYNSGVPLNDETTVQNGNVVSAWKNTGNANSDWTDLSGNGNNGTVSGSPATIYLPSGNTSGLDILGATIQRENLGELILDANGYAEAADDTTLDITTNITLESWIKPFSVSAAQTIIGKANAYQLEITSGAKPSFSKWTSTVETATATTSTTLSVDTWYHVAVTYDGTNVRIYIDGALDTTTGVTGAIDTTTTNVLIGALSAGSEEFDGYIDEPKVYSGTVLTAAQIKGNYDASKGAHAN